MVLRYGYGRIEGFGSEVERWLGYGTGVDTVVVELNIADESDEVMEYSLAVLLDAVCASRELLDDPLNTGTMLITGSILITGSDPMPVPGPPYPDDSGGVWDAMLLLLETTYPVGLSDV